MNAVLLIISLLGVPQMVFPMKDMATCEMARQHPSVIGTYQDLFGNEVLIYCLEKPQ